ncbi:hypothetical protein RUM44_005213 [Polyplax serrata]|uniref:Vacuolar protein sorting-associated protein 72 homolog n=1 Tax=Polyplax serrata TaxID=468196 RepID=A0ABR1AEF6_POLSC
MSLATTRERRNNAGNKMAKLMDAEEEDDFYKNTYGGFDEKEDDDDYKEEKEVEDVTDSDISIDENDEVISEDENEKKRKKSGVSTKAYKEPKPAVHTQQTKKNETLVPKSKKHISKGIQSKVNKLERKSIRRSTAAKSAATMQRLKNRIEIQKRRKMKRAPQQEVWKPTQEELLEEAKITEEENLKSLEKYQKMELEKKKTRIVKKVFTGPVIRYQSLTMPLIKEVTEEKVVVSDEQTENKTIEQEPQEKNEEVEQKVERTFITFESDEILNDIFKNEKVEERSKYCPITRLKAKYFDPVTNLPFSNLQAFRILREAYYQQLEARGNRNQPQVAAWLEWRKQQKDAQIKKLLKITK